MTIDGEKMARSCTLTWRDERYNRGMRKTIPSVFALLVLLLFSGSFSFRRPPDLRLEYYHTGDARQEFFSVDRVVIIAL